MVASCTSVGSLQQYFAGTSSSHRAMVYDDVSTLTEEFDLSHATHAVSAKIATPLLTPGLESLKHVLISLDSDVVILIQVLELDNIVFAGRNAGATVDGSESEVSGALELRVNAVLQSLVRDVEGNHKSEDLSCGRCMDLDLELSGW